MTGKCHILIVSLALFAWSLPGTCQEMDLSQGHWVDLTHSFNAQSVYWPTASEFEKTTVYEGHTEGGWYYTAYDFSAAEHGGTHIDSPIHFAEGKHTTDQIPLEQLIGRAVVIDVSAQVAENRDYQISPKDIVNWEEQHGFIPSKSIVLFNTGSAQFYSDRVAYMGTDGRGAEAVAKLHFSGIHPDTAIFLTSKRSIKAVGLDTPSIDFGQSKDFGSHVILYRQNIPGFENIANLDQLPPTGATVFALPMKIEGGSGGPLRIVAWVPQSEPDFAYLQFDDAGLTSVHGLPVIVKSPDGFRAVGPVNRVAEFNDRPFNISLAAYLGDESFVMVHAERLADESGVLDYSDLEPAELSGRAFTSREMCAELSTEEVAEEHDIAFLNSNGFDPTPAVYLRQFFTTSEDGNAEVVVSFGLRLYNCNADSLTPAFMETFGSKLQSATQLVGSE